MHFNLTPRSNRKNNSKKFSKQLRVKSNSTASDDRRKNKFEGVRCNICKKEWASTDHQKEHTTQKHFFFKSNFKPL